MTMLRYFALSAILLVISCPVMAAPKAGQDTARQMRTSPPLGFRGYTMGMGRVHATSLAEKEDNFENFTEGVAFTAMVSGVYSSVFLGFHDSEIHTIDIAFRRRDYESIIVSLTSKYGKPTHSATELFQNGLGATFPRQNALWKLPDGEIFASEYGVDNREQGRILIKSKAMVDAENAIEKQKKSQPGF